MKGLNRVQLIGNVGNDLEVKTLTNGHLVARFSFATTESFKNKEGVKNSETEWHHILAWNSLATIIQKHVQKGSLLHIQGKIHYRQYTLPDPNSPTREGVSHWMTEIIADDIIILNK
jgi:single-strand DNA-binding protein